MEELWAQADKTLKGRNLSASKCLASSIQWLHRTAHSTDMAAMEAVMIIFIPPQKVVDMAQTIQTTKILT